MLARVTAVVAVIGAFSGLIYLNNQQAKQLGLNEEQLGRYSSLVNGMIEEQDQLYTYIAARDEVSTQFLEKVDKLNDEKSDLTRELNNATKRLRVQAVCSSQGGTTDSSSPSAHNAELPELTPDAREQYLHFRVKYAKEHQAFKDLQDYVLELTKPREKN